MNNKGPFHSHFTTTIMLMILFISPHEAAQEPHDNKPNKGFEEGFKGGGNARRGGESDAHDDHDPAARLLVDFVESLDEASVVGFMEEWSMWAELASSSSCFDLRAFFARDKRGGRVGGGARGADVEELDTLDKINEVYGGVHESGEKCGAALLIGRRPTQEDRVICLPRLVLPSLGGNSVTTQALGFFGIFDGHNGEEASEFVSKCLHQYFLHEVYTTLGSLITDIFSLKYNIQPFLFEVAAKTMWKGSSKQDHVIRDLNTNSQKSIYSKIFSDEEDIAFKCSLPWNCLEQSFDGSPLTRKSCLKGRCGVAVEDNYKVVASNFHDSRQLLSRSCALTGVCQPDLVKMAHSSPGERSDFLKEIYNENEKALSRNYMRRLNEGSVRHCTLSETKGPRGSNFRGENNFEAKSRTSAICGGCFYRNVLKAALSKAIFDIDFAFYEEARDQGWEGGTTACIALMMDGHSLIANLGDSKAFFCSFPCKHMSRKGLKIVREALRAQSNIQRRVQISSQLVEAGTDRDGRSSCVEDLTQDHHPDRKEERLRIEVAGGFVEEGGGVPRVNGMLAVTRSIGDLPFKRYGVICEPEYTGWKPIDTTYDYLIVASDGVFEQIDTQDVCGLITTHALQPNMSELIVQKLSSGQPLILPPTKEEAKKQRDGGTYCSDCKRQNLSVVEFPIQLRPKEMIRQQQEVCSGNTRLVNRTEKFLSKGPFWRPALNDTPFSVEIAFQPCDADRTEFEAFKKSLRKDLKLENHGLLASHDSACHNSYRSTYKADLKSHHEQGNLLPQKKMESDRLDPEKIAEMIVKMAYNLGSTDNLAGIVLPLEFFHFQPSIPSSEHSFHFNEELRTKEMELHHAGKFCSAAAAVSNDKKNLSLFFNHSIASSDIMAIELNRNSEENRTLEGNSRAILMSGMLVHKQCYGCYELVERLSGDVILPFPHETDDESRIEEHRLMENENLIMIGREEISRDIQVYQDRQIFTCTVFPTEAGKGILASAAQLFRLIGSVPLDSRVLSPPQLDETLPYVVHHKRYILKKNVAHGAFGEIWLAFRKRCLTNGVQTLNSQNLTVKLDASLHSTRIRNESLCEEQITWIPETSSVVGDAHNDFADDVYILKRLLMNGDAGIPLSGRREKYFGELFLNASSEQESGEISLGQSSQKNEPYFPFREDEWKLNQSRYRCPINYDDCATECLSNMSSTCHSHQSEQTEGLRHIARYVDSFEIPNRGELWLVFRMEGKSLSSLLYDSEGTRHHPKHFASFQVLRPSHWWHWLKTTNAGKEEFRNLLRQLLLAVQACHAYNVTHRDIKPENMVVRSSGNESTIEIDGHPIIEWSSNLTLRLIDFGSALDPFTIDHLYGTSGPSEKEQTLEYAPPEVLLWKHWLHFHYNQAHAYDLWSIGVVMLELVLGTPHVFQVNARTHALLNRRLDGWDEASKQTAYMLRAFMEMCILLPGVQPHHYHHLRAESFKSSKRFGLASWDCTEEALLEQIKQRDPLHLGMPDVWSLRLLRQLLQWYPEDRIPAKDALKHPYFHPNLQTSTDFT